LRSDAQVKHSSRMDTQTRPPFLSVAELGARLGVSTRTAYNLIADGEVPVIEIRGVKRIPAAALERWLTDREEEALRAVRSE
jgi:excisionase family DNA binding protein